jgi:hypothetical protein
VIDALQLAPAAVVSFHDGAAEYLEAVDILELLTAPKA